MNIHESKYFKEISEILVPAYLHSELLIISYLVNIVQSAKTHHYYLIEGKCSQTENKYINSLSFNLSHELKFLLLTSILSIATLSIPFEC